MRNVLAIRLVGIVFGRAAALRRAVQARDWVKEMFKETTHDFGVVARGAKVEYRLCH